MCRIAGIASSSLPIEEMQQTVTAMCFAQRHGGPDGEGIYTDEEAGVVLGHRRLALIDLNASGGQPMHYANGRYSISFNGEIYNYREIKEELKALGHRFRSSGDTEVILAAFAAWGTASFQRLNGMFAFALFDRQTADVYLVRDAAGIKPLYYLKQKGTLVFASEVRAFHQLSRLPDDHPYWPVFLMAYGHLPEPVTTLKGVVPLPKGSFLKFNTRLGNVHRERFEHLRYIEKPGEPAVVTKDIATSMRRVLERHLISDVPIGVFLSGGIDSSVVALLAGKCAKEKLHTLSLYFTEERYSEKKYQDLVLGQLASKHYQHCLGEKEFHFHLPEIIEAMDLPSSDGINTWFISKLATEAGLKAVLSGLGGDELFGGYPSFHRIQPATLLQHAPPAALKAGRYSSAKPLRRLSYLSLEGPRGLYLFLRGHFTPDVIANYLDMDEKEVWTVLEEEPVLPDIHHLSFPNRASWMEFNLYMQNQLLRDADVMSMAHGVEIRVPFLDKEFIRLVFSVSSGLKYSGRVPKQLLINAFADTLPEAVWKRKKMGFSFPFAEWLKEDEWVWTKMMSGGKGSMKLMQKFREGKVHWSNLMTTLLLRTQHHEIKPAFLNA